MNHSESPRILILGCLVTNQGGQLFDFIAQDTGISELDLEAHLADLVLEGLIGTNNGGRYLGEWWILPTGKSWLTKPLAKPTVGNNQVTDPFASRDLLNQNLPAPTRARRGPDVQTPGEYPFPKPRKRKSKKPKASSEQQPTPTPTPPQPPVERAPNWFRRRYNWWIGLSDTNKIAIIVPTVLAALFSPSIYVTVQQPETTKQGATPSTTSAESLSVDHVHSPNERTLAPSPVAGMPWGWARFPVQDSADAKP